MKGSVLVSFPPETRTDQNKEIPFQKPETKWEWFSDPSQFAMYLFAELQSLECVCWGVCVGGGLWGGMCVYGGCV